MTRLFVLLLLTTTVAETAHALPRNFRNIDRFMVGGMPTEDDIDALHMLGIETFVGFHRMPRAVQKRAESYGMDVHFLQIRPHMHLVERAAEIIEDKPIGTVYVHCQHGADRTGLFVAYWLHTRRGYELFQALLTVIVPNKYQVEGLRRVASEYGLNLGNIDGSSLGRYSGSYLGHGGGMKVRGEIYARGVRKLVDFSSEEEPARSASLAP